jgi:hypothetical protein
VTDEGDIDATPGEGTGRQGPWQRQAGHPRDGMGGNVHDLDVENDPRGGVQSHAYRTADPREIVVDGDTVMMGPGGHPVGELEPDEVIRDPALDDPDTDRGGRSPRLKH